MTEYGARLIVEAGARAGFGPEYRGYSYRGVSWRAGNYSFRVCAYNPNSPINPLSMMFYDSAEVDDWREFKSADGRVAGENLKALIDSAYETPGRFHITKGCVVAWTP